MPALPFINYYKPGWKAKAAIKHSLSRFNRGDNSSSSSTPPPPPPPLLVPHSLRSPAVSTVLEITDDRSSLDFDGGQPDEYENDILDRTSEPRSSRPSNVSSVSPPAKLEVTLPPELRIDWFAEKFSGVPSHPRKADSDMDSLDQDTKDTLAGKIKDDQGLYQTLEDALALHVDSNPSRFVSISGLDLMLPGMSPINNLHPGALTIPNGLSDAGLLKHPRDSLTMLTSRLSTSDTPASSALSGTTLARALISNTFAMPIDRLSTSQREGGLTRSDSSIFPGDFVHRNTFSIAPDAPPMPPNAETQYVAPKKRRKQLKRRSSTGSLNNKALPDLPPNSPGRRTSLILSIGSEFDVVLKSRPWSSGTIPESSPRRLSNPALVVTTSPPTTPPTETTRNDPSRLPPLPEGVRRLPDPHSQPSTSTSTSTSAGVISPISVSSPSKELDTTGLEDVLEYYNLGDSLAPQPSCTAYRPDFSPILEETSSQSSAGSPFWNDRRDSKRSPPAGARSPRSTSSHLGRGDSLNLARRPSDARPSSKPPGLMLVPSQNGSSAGLSEKSGSLKSSRSFEPQYSDSASSHTHDTRNRSRQRSQSIPVVASAGVESSSPPGEEAQPPRSHDDSDSRRNVGEADASHSPGRVAQSDASHASDAPMINILPPIPASAIEITALNHRVRPLKIDTRSPESSPSRTDLAVPSASSNLSVSSSLVRSRSLPIDGVTFTPTFVISAGVPSANVEGVNGGGSSSRMTLEKSAFSRYPAVSDPSILHHHHHHHHHDFLGRNSTLSMGSPPPYYEAVNQAPMHHPGPNSTRNAGGHAAPSAPDPLAGPSRSSGEWNPNESRRDSPARTRIRPRPPLPIGPRRPSQGLHASMSLSETLHRSGSIASVSQHGLPPHQRSTRMPLAPSPKFHTPPPKWRGHTMDAARWTFKSSQLQAIVSKAIKQSSEASLIRLLEPEVLNDDIPAEIAVLEAQRTDIKTRYKLLARRRAFLFESSFHLLGGGSSSSNAEEGGAGYSHRVLEELSEIAGTMDHLSEELHSADNQLAHLDSLTQVHTSSALAVALRKLNTSFLKQMAENEKLRNELFSVEAERDEAWLQAERIAIELDQLAETADKPSPNLSNRSSRGSLSAHRRSIALKAGLSVSKRRSGGGGGKRQSPRVTPSPALSSKGFRPEKLVLPLVSTRKKPVPISTESALSASPVLVYSSPSPGTRTLIQTQDEIYAMLGLAVPDTSLKRCRSWKGSTPREDTSPSSSHHPAFLSNDSLHRCPQPQRRALRRRSASLPPDSTLAQFSNAMAADRNAMLFTFDMLSATDNDCLSR